MTDFTSAHGKAGAVHCYQSRNGGAYQNSRVRLSPYNITVNAIYPGCEYTSMFDNTAAQAMVFLPMLPADASVSLRIYSACFVSCL